MPGSEHEPESHEWLREPSSEQLGGAGIRIIKESDVSPELRKALEDVASELAKHPQIISHKSCQKVTIRCPKVTIVDGCVILITCDGYNG